MSHNQQPRLTASPAPIPEDSDTDLPGGESSTNGYNNNNNNNNRHHHTNTNNDTNNNNNTSNVNSRGNSHHLHNGDFRVMSDEVGTPQDVHHGNFSSSFSSAMSAPDPQQQQPRTAMSLQRRHTQQYQQQRQPHSTAGGGAPEQDELPLLTVQQQPPHSPADLGPSSSADFASHHEHQQRVSMATICVQQQQQQQQHHRDAASGHDVNRSAFFTAFSASSSRLPAAAAAAAASSITAGSSTAAAPGAAARQSSSSSSSSLVFPNSSVVNGSNPTASGVTTTSVSSGQRHSQTARVRGMQSGAGTGSTGGSGAMSRDNSTTSFFERTDPPPPPPPPTPAAGFGTSSRRQGGAGAITPGSLSGTQSSSASTFAGTTGLVFPPFMGMPETGTVTSTSAAAPAHHQQQHHVDPAAVGGGAQLALEQYVSENVELNQLPLTISDALWRLGAILASDERAGRMPVPAVVLPPSSAAESSSNVYEGKSSTNDDDDSNATTTTTSSVSAAGDSKREGDENNESASFQPAAAPHQQQQQQAANSTAAAQSGVPLLLSRDASYETAESLFRKLAAAFEALPESLRRRRIVMPYEVRRAPCRIVRLDMSCLGCVCTFLPAPDIEALAATCSTLHRLLRDNEYVWQQLCCNSLPRHHAQQITSERPPPDAEQGASWRQVMRARAESDRLWFTRRSSDMDVRGFHVSRGVHTVVLDEDNIYFTTSQHYEMQCLNLRTGARPFGAGIHTGHQHSITSMKIVQDFPEYIITASVDASLRLFDRNLKQPAGEFKGHTDRIWGVDTYRELVFSGGTDRTVRMWSMQDRSHCGIIEEQHTSVSSVRVMRSQSAAYIACGSSGSSIRVWDIGNGVLRSVARFRGHQKGVYCLQDTGRLLFSGSLDNVIYGWDPRVNFGRAMSLVQYDSHGRPIVNTATSGPPLEHIGIVTFTVDDTKLVAGCADNSVRIWDLRMQRMVNELKEHTHWVTWVQFDSKKLISTSRDRTIRIWDVDGTLGSYLHGSIGSMRTPAAGVASASSPTTNTGHSTIIEPAAVGSPTRPNAGAAQTAE